MDNRSESEQVLKLVNMARATYGAYALEALPQGELHSAPFCPIGRSLRRGAEDWLFVTVGSKHVRLWAIGKDPVAIAQRIMTVWAIPLDRLQQSRDRPGIVIFPLPPELRKFVDRFDHGLLPVHQGKVGRVEVQQLRVLANRMPVLSGLRKKDVFSEEFKKQ
jgi:hypothetical protein